MRRHPSWLLLPVLVLLGGCAALPMQGRWGREADGCAAPRGSFVTAGEAWVRPTSLRWWLRPPAQRRRDAEVNLPAALTAENAELDSLQIAFDSLLYCRWIEARTIRADLAARRTPPPVAEARMAALRARLRADLDRARAVIAALERQAEARAAALEAEAPGTGAAEAARQAGAEGRPRPVVAAATVLLRLRPEAGAPEVGRVAAGEGVAIRPAAAGFAAVESGGRVRGYAPAGAFQVPERAAPARTAAAANPLRVLAATNLARRDNFAESVALAETASVSGFELAS